MVERGGASRAPVLLLAAVVAATFAPLLAGMNFLPFTRTPDYSSAMLQASGQAYEEDRAYIERNRTYLWFQEMEDSSVTLLYPLERFAATHLRRGSLPLWDPYTGCGTPTLDNGFFRPFNPFRVPFYALPTSWTYCLSLLLGLLTGIWGAFLWLRRELGDGAAAAVGAGIFALNPWVLEHLVLPDAPSYFLLPWCLLALDRTRWRDWASLATAALVLTLSGQISHPEGFVLMAGLALVRHLFAPGRNASPKLGERLAVVATVTLASTVTLMVLWLPAMKLYLEGFSYKQIANIHVYHFDWRGFLGLSSDLFVAPVLGALLAAALPTWRKDRQSGFWLLCLLTSALILMPLPGLGHHLTEWVQRITWLPAFYLKASFWAACAFLAPRGFLALRDAPLPTVRRILTLAVGIGLLAGQTLLLVLLPIPLELHAMRPLIAIVLLAAGLAVLMVLQRTRGKPLLQACAATALLLPLAWPLSLDQLAWNRLDIKTNPLVEWVRSTRPHDRAVSPVGRPVFAIPPNLGQVYSVRCGEQFAVLFPNYYSQLYRGAGIPFTYVAFDRVEPLAFRQLGASLVLLPTCAEADGLPRLYQDACLSAYEVPGASGRLFFASKTAHRDPALRIDRQIVSLGAETDTCAVVEAMGQTLPANIPAVPPATGRASFRLDGIHQVDIRAQSPSGGLLVLKDTWYRGWAAAMDGRAVPIFRVNGCFRGVIVPAGTHDVRFLYRPKPLYQAGAASAISILVLLGIALARRKKAGGEG
jgi:hypothetical protein